MMTDLERRAESAYRTVIALRNWGENDPETDLADFLCDLRHLCDEQGWDWNEILSRADFHYIAEVSEDKS